MEKNSKAIWNRIGIDKLCLLAAAGVALLICSFPGQNSGRENKEVQTTAAALWETDELTNYVEKMEKRLSELLKNIKGVGEVHVMITLKASEKKEVLKDVSSSSESRKESDADGTGKEEENVSRDEKTIYGSDENGEEAPFVLGENMPKVEGVAVVAEGAVQPEIREKIIYLVQALFDIGVNKIMVTA